MTQQPPPVLLALDDREGLVRAAPGVSALGDLCDVRVVGWTTEEVLTDDLLDPGALAGPGALGRLRTVVQA